MCDVNNYTLSWWHFAPFVFSTNDGHGHLNKVSGIMLDAIREAAELCCRNKQYRFAAFQCQNQEEMLSNVTHDYTIAAPVIIPSTVAAMKPSEYFIRMADISGMIHVAKHNNGVTQVLMEAFFAVWPLVLALIVLTGYAAIILWLLQFKESADPSAICSLFDWYWFSFITAATVGYGDKLPKGVLSKTFTMIWAVFGISIMVATTATLTTLLTQHQQSVSKLQPVKGSKVGVLAGSIERRFVMQRGGIPVEFDSLNEMDAALHDGSLEQMVFDHYTFHHRPRALPQHFQYEVIETPEVTIGYILFAPHRREFVECLRLQSFLAELKVDSKLIKQVGHKVEDDTYALFMLQNAADTIFSSSLKFTLLLLGLVCLGITAAIMLCSFLLKTRCQSKSRRPIPSDDPMPLGKHMSNRRLDREIKMSII